MNNANSRISHRRSSSDDAERHSDPDYYMQAQGVPPRNHPKRTVKKMERWGEDADSSSSTRPRRKRTSETLLSGTRLRRTTNNENGRSKVASRKTLISWLVKNNAIKENTKVCVIPSKEGYIREGGIICLHCDRIHTPLEFITHDTQGCFSRPYENIFVAESHISLFDLLKNVLVNMGLVGPNGPIGNGPEPVMENHDDVCLICADGGNLMCCEGCTSAYHHECMGLKEVPEGVWFCPYCKCKFCDSPCLEDPVRCFQCDKKYHWSCYQGSAQLEANDLGVLLCDNNCKEVYDKLGGMVGVPQQLGEGFTWTLLRYMHENIGVGLRDFYQIIECHAKLAMAKDLISECFDPVRDRHSGIDMIENVVFNCRSNYNRINFRGFYKAIMEKDDEIVSVASLRIHGRKFAELPFVATSENFRGQGNCGILMAVVESALYDLKIENIVLPSTTDARGEWIYKYGFQDINPSVTEELRKWNTLTFHDSVRLQKVLYLDQAERRYETGESSKENSHSRLEIDLNKLPEEDC